MYAAFGKMMSGVTSFTLFFKGGERLDNFSGKWPLHQENITSSTLVSESVLTNTTCWQQLLSSRHHRHGLCHNGELSEEWVWCDYGEFSITEMVGFQMLQTPPQG